MRYIHRPSVSKRLSINYEVFGYHHLSIIQTHCYSVKYIFAYEEQKAEKETARMKLSRTVGPIPLVQISQGEHRYKLNERGIERYLLSRKVRDLRIAVVSVTGSMRKGKSYILNLILNQAMETCEQAEQDETFSYTADECVKGFQIGDPGGREAHGIFIWPEIFVRRTKTGGCHKGILSWRVIRAEI